jgi:hypothetical protein
MEDVPPSPASFSQATIRQSNDNVNNDLNMTKVYIPGNTGFIDKRPTGKKRAKLIKYSF